MNLDALRAAAESESVLFVPRIESHPAGAFVGLGAAACGVIASRFDFPGRDALLWVCLAGLFAGMALHWRWKRLDTGWRVDFAARRVEPVGLRGETAIVDGEGWQIQTAPGDRRIHVAIDLRHRDRGRVARLFDAPVRGRAELSALSALADILARRLGAERSGPRA